MGVGEKGREGARRVACLAARLSPLPHRPRSTPGSWRSATPRRVSGRACRNPTRAPRPVDARCRRLVSCRPMRQLTLFSSPAQLISSPSSLAPRPPAHPTGGYPDFPDADDGGSRAILNPPPPTLSSILEDAAGGDGKGKGKDAKVRARARLPVRACALLVRMSACVRVRARVHKDPVDPSSSNSRTSLLD
jgi:hypothetical protein